MMVRIGPMQMAEAKPFTTSISKYASRLSYDLYAQIC